MHQLFAVYTAHCVHAYVSTEAHTKTSASEISRKRCPKCGIVKKSGKLSCCARGGAWFKQCGDAGDSTFDHTWVEGIQTCNYFKSSLAIEAPVQAMLRHERVVMELINTTWIRNTAKQQIVTDRTGNMFYAAMAGSKYSVRFIKIVVFAVLVCVTVVP